MTRWKKYASFQFSHNHASYNSKKPWLISLSELMPYLDNFIIDRRMRWKVDVLESYKAMQMGYWFACAISFFLIDRWILFFHFIVFVIHILIKNNIKEFNNKSSKSVYELYHKQYIFWNFVNTPGSGRVQRTLGWFKFFSIGIK